MLFRDCGNPEPFIVHILAQYDRWWKVFTWKSNVSSQLKTSTKRPIWLPRAFTDSVLPVPAGPRYKHTMHVTGASNSTTILTKYTVLKLQQLYNVVQFPCLSKFPLNKSMQIPGFSKPFRKYVFKALIFNK